MKHLFIVALVAFSTSTIPLSATTFPASNFQAMELNEDLTQRQVQSILEAAALQLTGFTVAELMAMYSAGTLTIVYEGEGTWAVSSPSAGIDIFVLESSL